MKKLLISCFLYIFVLNNTARAYEPFEIDPQIRPKISLGALLNKEWGIFSGEKIAAGFGKLFSTGGVLTFEYPFAQNFALGVQTKAAFDLDHDGPSFYDFNLLPKVQFDLSEGALASNMYLSIPAGFSLLHWDELESLSKGFNAGLLLGSHFYFAERFGLYTEFGYGYKRIWAVLKRDSTELDLSFHGLLINLGLSVGF